MRESLGPSAPVVHWRPLPPQFTNDQRASCHQLPPRLRRVLHRSFDYQPDSRNAWRETRRRQVRPACGRQSVPHLRQAGTAGVLRRIAALRRDVRLQPRTSNPLAGRSGAGDRAGVTAAARRAESSLRSFIRARIDHDADFPDPLPLLYYGRLLLAGLRRRRRRHRQGEAEKNHDEKYR